MCVCVCLCDTCCVRAMKLLRRSDAKKNGSNFDLSVRYFWFSYEQEEKERHKCLQIKERERERTHARAHHHSRFSIIIVSDLYQRDREKEWLRERFE
jgi:hypothetical protein